MILKNFLIGFGGVATITGVGIGVYYGTNSSEEIKNEVNALKSIGSEDKKPDEKDTQNNLESGNNNAQSQPSNK